jgi:chromosome segregation protein
MFLKSLSVKGFKSFADPTVLEFEPGITVVVGPNGSGKSNVVDAVTWVLGAQGPRSLRSAKMEDVIFAGTSSRPQLGRAEVSLTIDNSSGKLPVDLAEVTITRTLFRSGDSEYAINGAPCRLLDIQELLADSGVGRQQHMIIGQGQLDTVLNARPEDRRAIIEEAAGVLKHRRRRERAERRLAATAENLERLGDLVREVRRQIRPLERQAAAARSHDSVASELREVRRYLAGVEMAELAARRTAATQGLAVCRDEERELHQTLDDLDAEASSTTAELSSRREEDLADALGRVQGLVERARGLSGLLRERGRSVAAALDAAADVDVVSTLESEAARLAAEMSAADDETQEFGGTDRAELAAALETLDTEQAQLVARWESVLDGDHPDQAAARLRARTELVARTGAREHHDVESLSGRLATLEERNAAAAVRADLQQATAADLESATPVLESDLATRTAELEQAAAAAEVAQQAADEAEEGRHRTAARAEALERALAEMSGAGGHELLREVDGVVGSLVDLVEIDDGWEAAFEAAAGAGVATVVVDGPGSAQRALARLRDRGVTGAVLAPRAGRPRTLSDGDLSPGSSAEPVRRHVRARHGGVEAEAVLDALVGRAVRVDGWEEAIDLSLAHDELVVVTPAGDRFATTGWRVRSGTAVVTAAAVEEAGQRAQEAAAASELARAGLAERRVVLARGRDARAAAERALDRHLAALDASRADGERAVAESGRLASELDEARAELVAARGRHAQASTEAQELAASVALVEEAAAAWHDLEGRRGALVERTRELDVRAAGLAERRRVLAERHAEVERRLQGHTEERATAEARRRRLEDEGTALRRLEGVVVREHGRLDAVFEELRREYRDQVDAVRAGGERLEQLRQDRHTTEQRLDGVRTRTRTLDLEMNEVDLRAEALREHVHRDLATTPEQLVGLPEPSVPEDTTHVQHAEELERKLVALGPVNPLALEELSALEERHRELEAQVDDVRGARRELHEVVRTLDDEIMTSFAAAAADVNEHFSTLVAMLFPGGTGRLVLVDPDDLLNTGVEIEVRPAGRNVRRVSLLSGGERSMAALAFLFAVFRSRPSPFYLMDEVEAALDDVNLTRFLALVHEFRDEAQLLIVSHQKRTMETADALYGVTMAPGGSSQVVSQKVHEPA